MPRQSAIRGGLKKSTAGTDRGSGWGRVVAIGGAATVLLFLLSLGVDHSGGGGTTTTSGDVDNLRSGQAHQHTTSTTTTSSSTSYDYYDQKSDGDEIHNDAADNNDSDNNPFGSSSGGATTNPDDNVDTTPGNGGTSSYTDDAVVEKEEEMVGVVDAAAVDIQSAEDEELRKEKGVLHTALSAMGNSIRIGLGQLMGRASSSKDDGAGHQVVTALLEESEMETIAEQVEERLKTSVEEELEDRADEVTGEELDRLDSGVDEEEGMGVSMEEIEKDVYKQEGMAVATVKTEIDQAADDIQSSLKTRAVEIEKEILEERLTKRLGKKVKLVIVEDEIQGIEDLVEGLTNLDPSQQAPPPSTDTSTTNPDQGNGAGQTVPGNSGSSYGSGAGSLRGSNSYGTTGGSYSSRTQGSGRGYQYSSRSNDFHHTTNTNRGTTNP